MKKRALGATGLEVSEVGVGGWQLAGPLTLDGKADGHPDVGRDYAVDLIHRCADLGINVIDLAEQYGDGEGERRAGAALAGQRDRWVVCTKFGALVGPGGERVRDVSAARVPQSLAGSLRRLGTDYIDVYLYHQPPDPAEAEAVARYLEDAKRKGMVRAVGISTRRVEDCETLRTLGALDVVEFPANMVQPNDDFRRYLRQHRLGGIVRGAYAAGRLTGKYFERAPTFSADDLRAAWFPGNRASTEYTRFAQFSELVTAERSMTQLALRYLLDEPTTHTIVIGAKRVEEYAEAVGACDLSPLTDAEQARIAVLRQAIGAPG